MAVQLRLVSGVLITLAILASYQNCADSGASGNNDASKNSISTDSSGGDQPSTTTNLPGLPQLPPVTTGDAGTSTGACSGGVHPTTAIGKLMDTLYCKALKRGISQGEVDSWSTQYNSGMTCPMIVRSIVLSPEAKALYPADVAGYLTYLYQSILNRDPDSSGSAYFSSVLNQAQNSAAVRAYVRDSLEASDELQAICQTRALKQDDGVIREAHILFITALHRGIEETTDSNNFWEGVYNQSNHPSCVRLISSVARSTEALTFAKNSCTSSGGSLDVTCVVNWMYPAVLARAVDAPSASFWANEVKVKGIDGALKEMIQSGATADSELYQRCKGLGLQPGSASDI